MIVPQELKNYRNISNNYKFDRIQEQIELAKNDMREHIGDAVYFDIMGNLETESYQDLLEGSDFIIDTITYTHSGLKSMFADFVYSRYVSTLNTNHTPHGLVTKDSQDSTPVDRNLIKDMVKQSQIDADKKWELIKYYLNANVGSFPVWKSKNYNTNSNDVRPGSTRFSFLSTGRNNKL